MIQKAFKRSLLFLIFLITGPSFISPASFLGEPFLRRKIALTFDDGPRPLATRRLQQILKRFGARGTFFVVGQVAASNPEVVRSLVKGGHEIANHTWSHSDLKKMSPASLSDELEGTRLLIEELTGRNSYLFRTPGSTEKFIRLHFTVPPKYTLILWDVHSLDHEGLSPLEIAQRVELMAKDGDIILMHNGKQNTAQALEILIPSLRSRGFEFTTLSEILQYRQKHLTSAIDPAVLRG